MAQFTNTGEGARGINMKDGTTSWVEPGQTVELNKGDVARIHEDIEEGAKAAKEAAPADDADEAK